MVVKSAMMFAAPFQTEYAVDINNNQIHQLKDQDGDIRFHKVFDWLLPKYEDDVGFYEFIAGRMRNYMIHIMRSKAFTPRFFDPPAGIVITGDNVARFFGCQMGRMLRGFPSINATWSTRESLTAIGPVMESMPKNVFQDI